MSACLQPPFTSPLMPRFIVQPLSEMCSDASIPPLGQVEGLLPTLAAPCMNLLAAVLRMRHP